MKTVKSGSRLHSYSRDPAKEKDCSVQHSKRVKMNGKAKKQMTPDTTRSTPSSNWERFMEALSKSPSSNIKNSTEKNNIHKKQQSKKSIHKNKALLLLKKANLADVEDMDGEVTEELKKGLTKHIAMDCEMVGIGDGTESMIARVSIVNRYGYCVYDKYVKPREPVVNYRTKVSGIRPHHIENGEDFKVVQKEVAEILKHRVLVGHAIKHDLEVLFLSHPRKSLRDTSRFKPFTQLFSGNTPSLKRLASELLGKDIQVGEHSSVEDARAAMQLYVLYKNKWESEFYSKRH